MTSPATSGVPPRATRILIVEDELMIRMLLDDMLRPKPAFQKLQQMREKFKRK